MGSYFSGSLNQAANVVAMPTAGANRLEILLELEAQIRTKPNCTELILHMVNETRRLLGFGQATFVQFNRNGKAKIEAVSSLSSSEPHAPLTQWFAAAAQDLYHISTAHTSVLPAPDIEGGYPFLCCLYLPLKDRRSRVFGAIMLLRAHAWAEGDATIGGRLAETYAHAFQALTPPKLLFRPSLPRKWVMAIMASILMGLILIPVPMSALAPFEVIADDPFIITAPLDGAIADIRAEPNQMVVKGAPLFDIEASDLRSKADIAEKKSLVSQARLATLRQSAFSDFAAKRELAVAEYEVKLAEAESYYAKARADRATIVAPNDGLLIYSRKTDWLGKPVSIGEKIMILAQPDKTAFRIDLGVHDSIALNAGAKVRLFLDADPLHPRAGILREASFHASEGPGGSFAYRLIAVTDANTEASRLRIGLRGTAQIYGENVSLGFYLFRRPIAALRQYFGV